MNHRANAITAAGQRFGVALQQAEDGWLTYPERSMGW
jgi:hypothetical protein